MENIAQAPTLQVDGQEFKSYAPLLEAFEISFIAVDIWLQAGNAIPEGKWVLYISVVPNESIEMLEKVLPLLKEQRVPFILIKDQIWHYRLNGGSFPMQAVGKSFVIYPSTEAQAMVLCSRINSLTEGFTGLEVPDSIRLGRVLYTKYFIKENAPLQQQHQYKAIKINHKKLPFTVPTEYLKTRSKWIIGKKYAPVKVLQSGFKGAIFLAVNIGKFPFRWCVIKQGKAYAVADPQNRTIRDRLLWQKEVLRNLPPSAMAPAYIDYFEEYGDSYLVTEYIEGKVMAVAVTEKLQKRLWSQVPEIDRKLIFAYFLSIINLIDEIHKHGYIHRDITPANFIINKGLVRPVDFELTFDVRHGIPQPAYTLGTAGFVAPEQLQRINPSPKEDIYSLGAMLTYLCSGDSPAGLNIIGKPLEQITKLTQLHIPPDIIEIIAKCLSLNPGQRPTICELREYVNAEWKKLAT